MTLNERSYGENSVEYSTGLRVIRQLYYAQRQNEKAQPYLEKAVKIDQTLYGRNGMQQMQSADVLCKLYENLKQPAKAEACAARMLVLLEKLYGVKSSV